MRAAVLGSPISHSLSPVLHRAAYQALGLQHTYEAIEVNVEGFRAFIDSLDKGWLGLSLTMPLKEIAFTVADVVSETALLTQSINTLTFANGIHAENTDVYGICAAIKESVPDPMATGFIFGSGATARSAIMSCSELGISSIVLVARNAESISICAELAERLGITFRQVMAPDSELNDADVVINTTPQGVADQWTPSVARPRGLLLDAVYQPHPTALVSTWLEHGGVACPGYNMLLHQAVRQVELMTSLNGPVEVMREALLTALRGQGTIS